MSTLYLHSLGFLHDSPWQSWPHRPLLYSMPYSPAMCTTSDECQGQRQSTRCFKSSVLLCYYCDRAENSKMKTFRPVCQPLLLSLSEDMITRGSLRPNTTYTASGHLMAHLALSTPTHDAAKSSPAKRKKSGAKHYYTYPSIPTDSSERYAGGACCPLPGGCRL